jgi:hypothetical protein
MCSADIHGGPCVDCRWPLVYALPLGCHLFMCFHFCVRSRRPAGSVERSIPSLSLARCSERGLPCTSALACPLPWITLNGVSMGLLNPVQRLTPVQISRKPTANHGSATRRCTLFRNQSIMRVHDRSDATPTIHHCCIRGRQARICYS